MGDPGRTVKGPHYKRHGRVARRAARSHPRRVDTPPPSPFAFFDRWYADARAAEPSDPNAMTLATVDAAGWPQARIVLLKAHDARGFVFYTNLESAKSDALARHPAAALLFHWKSAKRQVRISGSVSRAENAEADAYFATRPYESQVSAWASRQSAAMTSRAEYEARLAATRARFEGGPVPRPPFWSGWRVAPRRFEFWEERAFRQHERCTYSFLAGGGWRLDWLFP
jgi:pyridoxamine 5'-phosphate oxidase